MKIRFYRIIGILMIVGVLAAALFLLPFRVNYTYADELEGQTVIDKTETDNPTDHEDSEEVEPPITEPTEDEEDKIDEMVRSFKAYLMEKYGEDYEYYYNLIIDNYGSVENYLIQIGNKLPETYQSSWQSFVGWLSEYASVWAPVLAVAIVIIVSIVGKKTFNSLVEKIVNAKLSPIIDELNKQSNATVSLLHAQQSLMGTNEKFADNVKEMAESEKELTNG